MKILLVEDEAEIGDLIKTGLEKEEFSVDYCKDGDSGMEHAMSNSYDAIVLDVMLPGKSGLEILKMVRAGQNNVPIIIITARGETEDRIEGLDLGADDYLPKPFFVEELIARLRAIWRRSSETGMSVLNVGTLSANLMSREVVRSGRQIEMTPKEFSLLAFLMRAPGRVLTRTQILEQVWGYHFDPGTNLVDVYIRRLRSKIDFEGEIPLIETLRGVGYRMQDPDNSEEG
ncbi:MAG: DNA-binding response regulator [Verrucomicrobiales bacterium]|nr:DNA-binding response regulator [Verrucomicrobiales bacterium]MBB26752.1 DNA-binding response regulator [Verrucomicrobiaceae bacterium]MEC9042777.1 response regulator transcription factor [Verrucomicrobiota bacterium]MAC49708.1 DNA-binding response regulator [Verrucomicrobiales bacterium]MAN82816.1 DNA-binding response regulator [Verrucomicrobiales bacterium]